MSDYPVKIPAFQFYPADWRKDPAVQSLSYNDRGVWFEMLCIMHESSERGKLLLNGKPMPLEVLARLLGLDKQALSNAIESILESGTGYRDENGAIYSKRMMKDEAIRRARHEAGMKGGNPALLKQKVKQLVKGGVARPGNQTGEDEDEDEVSFREGGVGGNPTFSEIQTFCQMGAGIDLRCGEAFWNSMEACGWIDRAQRPVKDWRALLRNYAMTWRANEQKTRMQNGEHKATIPLPTHIAPDHFRNRKP